MTYDLSIIGAGWAGFNAAIAAARLGKTVCLIEEKEIGGTCLNRGCIPTKVFVAESKKNSDLQEIQKRKTEVISRLSQGMSYLLKSHNIAWVQGRGMYLGPERFLSKARERLGPDSSFWLQGRSPEKSPKNFLTISGSFPATMS